MNKQKNKCIIRFRHFNKYKNMHKDKALEHIKQKLSSKEDLIGFFYAQKPPKFWLFFIIGPLAMLSIRHYFVAVTNTGIHRKKGLNA